MKRRNTCLIAALGIFAVSAPMAAVSAKAEQKTFAWQYEVADTYALGETVDFPCVTYGTGNNDEDCRASLLYQSDMGTEVVYTTDYAENLSYTFDKTGEWTIVYEAKTSKGMVSESSSFVVEKTDYIEIEECETAVSFGSIGLIPKAWFVKNDGGRYECNVIATSPDGNTLDNQGNVSFLQIGEYVYEYSYQNGNDTFVKTKRVNCTLAYENLFDGDGQWNAEANQNTPYWSEQKNGILIQGGRGSEIRYRNTIDLTSLDKDKNLVEFQAVNNVEDDYAFDEFDVVLTDKYDSDNQLTIKYRNAGKLLYAPWVLAQSYISVSVNGSNFCGVEGKNTNYYPYGSVVQNSFYGTLGYNYNNQQEHKLFSFQIDPTDYSVYTKNKSGSQGSSSLVLNPYDYDKTGVVWKGFTTGEVYLSFKFPEKATAPKILVTEIAGEGLSGLTVVDNQAPSFSFQKGERYENVLPDGQVNAKYPLPVLTANDLFTGVCAVKTELYKEDELLGDGKNFTPQEVGSYKVVYTATDVFGNLAQKILRFEVKDSVPKIEATLAKDTIGTVGRKFTLPEIILTGGTGELSYAVRATFNGEETFAEDGEYLFFEEGVLTLYVTVEDYLGSYMVAIDVDVVAADEPVTVIENIPLTAIKGQTLVFPDFEAIDYKNGTECYKTIYVNGQRLGDDRAYLVKETDESLFVEYITRAGVFEKVETFVVAVSATDGVLDLFVTPDFVQRKMDGNDGFRFTASKDFFVTAPQALSLQDFSFEFKAEGKMEYLDVELTDYARKSNTVLIRICEKDDKTSYVYVNGGSTRYTVNGSFRSKTATFIFTITDNSICFDGEKIVKIETYENGKKFDGFGDGRILLRVYAKNVAAETSVWAYRLSNQSFISVGTFFGDSGPKIIYEQKMRNQTAALNDRILVSAARALDVFTGETSVVVTVTTPLGNKIYSEESSENVLSFIVTQYGNYTVSYVAVDGKGNEWEDVFTISVKDRKAPQISVYGTYESSYKVGTSVKIVNAVATDDQSDKVSVIAYVVAPNNVYYGVQIGKTFRFEKKGEYKIVYLAFDDEMNCSRKEFTVNVR